MLKICSIKFISCACLTMLRVKLMYGPFSTKVKLLKIGLLLTDTFCNINEETPYLNALTYKLFGNASLIGTKQMSLVKI